MRTFAGSNHQVEMNAATVARTRRAAAIVRSTGSEAMRYGAFRPHVKEADPLRPGGVMTSFDAQRTKPALGPATSEEPVRGGGGPTCLGSHT
jgi:hypothetical protein